MEFDPELVEAFQGECKDLVAKLDQILDQLDQGQSLDETKKSLELYGQIIDRMMGAAKALSMKRIASFCELGKMMGYKSSQSDDESLHQLVIAFLFDATEQVRELIDQLPQSEDENHPMPQAASLLSRLKWLMEKFKHIERASVEIGDKSKKN